MRYDIMYLVNRKLHAATKQSSNSETFRSVILIIKTIQHGKNDTGEHKVIVNFFVSFSKETGDKLIVTCERYQTKKEENK